MSVNYPKKSWYVAATSAEITDAPVARRMLDTPIVLWRDSDGTVRAFHDRCAHRGLPLSEGSIAGDQLVCSYHGCTYDVDGRCVHVAPQAEVPSGMRVPTRAVFEAPPFIWVWGGTVDSATGTRPPRTAWLNDDSWTTFSSSWTVAANYLMVHEHYLDFSYAPVLHARDVPPGIERLPAHDDVEITETTVSYSRKLPEAMPAEWEAEATGLDRSQAYSRLEQGTFASPGLYIQRWSIHSSEDTDFTHIRLHAITPETPDRTRVFMQISRDYALGSDVVTELLRSKVDELIERDTAMVELASANVGYDGWCSGIEFRSDAAVMHVRRIIGRMLAKEAGRSPLPPGVTARSAGR
ncbi:(2Fe-2S)-binding protein [Mycobacterium sp. CBMA 234]|uniref:aromatic ring-hydroxylating dioxygenase subunit alpha n=1 Tax=Mycolicibacterium sp. CBMA 234 TaxID=1918495 RepID=UPI0012DC1952|nr:aromatic ring-hydroxylating dioxygenase subunit alpha [Mycolicibacterium sp. CBMA 234]MUL65975.1 (2Fe-2S)-binding protein [Mycolicibacterium sp. CBMA 234]